MLQDAREHPGIVVAGDQQPLLFDKAGNLADLGDWRPFDSGVHDLAFTK
jgi:hypothetical protein